MLFPYSVSTLLYYCYYMHLIILLLLYTPYYIIVIIYTLLYYCYYIHLIILLLLYTPYYIIVIIYTLLYYCYYIHLIILLLLYTPYYIIVIIYILLYYCAPDDQRCMLPTKESERTRSAVGEAYRKVEEVAFGQCENKRQVIPVREEWRQMSSYIDPYKCGKKMKRHHKRKTIFMRLRSLNYTHRKQTSSASDDESPHESIPILLRLHNYDGVRNLGVIFYSDFSFHKHVSNIMEMRRLPHTCSPPNSASHRGTSIYC